MEYTIKDITFYFANEERRRSYGKRVGDIVRTKHSPFVSNGKTIDNNIYGAEVVAVGLGDNNSALIRLKDGKIISYVAEWLHIEKKVEDRAIDETAFTYLNYLATKEFVDRNMMSNREIYLAEKLVKMGIVTKGTAEGDARRKIFYLTNPKYV